jgi:hypothetical protein
MQNVGYSPEADLSNSSFGSEIQDGVKIQNVALKQKKIIFAVKWPIFNKFQINFFTFGLSYYLLSIKNR